MTSLITSLYRSERYLPEFLKKTLVVGEFLVENNFDFEIVIVANDPTQMERNLILTAQKRQKWLRYYAVEREPISASWNRGIELASGNILGFWNVDDGRFPEAIMEGSRLISQGSLLVYFPFIYKRYVKFLGLSWLVKRKLIKPAPFEQKEFTRSMQEGPFYMFSRKFYQTVGPYDEQFKICQDFDWCVRAAKKGIFTLSNMVAGVFVNEGTSLSGSKNPRHEAEDNVALTRSGATDKLHPIDPVMMEIFNIQKVLYKGKFLDL